jgi:hypothetical protein
MIWITPPTGPSVNELGLGQKSKLEEQWMLAMR